ncbi:hypothetical protein Pfo_001540 [Paulownia fortunei]|nr:hypothetical protein Pfo_001540 [Paulownia fortunei]
MESSVVFGEKEWLACCGSVKFAQAMVSAGPFSNYQEALNAARDIWFNKVDVNGWLEAFSAHHQIGENPSQTTKAPPGEQSTALATASDSTLQELFDWSTRYKQKFGFIFLITASGRSTPEILAEMKKRYRNKPIVEFEVAAKEQLNIIELHLSKLFSINATAALPTKIQNTADVVTKGGEDRVSIIGGHLTAANETPAGKPSQTFTRTRPPLTTRILDIWENNQSQPLFDEADSDGWKLQCSSTTDKNGRSSQVRELQEWEHRHVPLLLSHFSFTTYTRKLV